ncbi:hypothetical protein [Spirochaeta thermophila]|nr:hypothetical protein [Spirochaeta thermophila]
MNMKRIIGVGMLICIGVAWLVGQEVAEGEMEEVARFRIGGGKGELGYRESPGPITIPYKPVMGHALRGLLIFDIMNGRFVFLDTKGYRVEREVRCELDYETTPYQVEEDVFVLSRPEWYRVIEVYDARRGEMAVVNDERFKDYRSWWYYGGVLFIQDAEGRLWSVPDPEVDEEANRRKVLDEEGTRRYVEERWGESGEVRIDEEGRLFIRGELATRDYTTWFEYRTGEKIEVIRGNTYLGKDKDGNVYWGSIGSVVVYPPEREKGITRIVRLALSKILGSVVVDGQTGDLYVLGKPEGGEIPLYRIRRDW